MIGDPENPQVSSGRSVSRSGSRTSALPGSVTCGDPAAWGVSSQNALPFVTDDYRPFPGRCAPDVPSVTSGNNTSAGYLFHAPEDVYNPPAADRPPPPIWRQLLTDIAWTVGILGAVIVASVASDLT